jgi:hypothetical protein
LLICSSPIHAGKGLPQGEGPFKRHDPSVDLQLPSVVFAADDRLHHLPGRKNF